MVSNINEVRMKAAELMEKAGVILTEQEKSEIQVVDYGLNRLAELGIQMHIYANNERYCAKELVLFPGQICVEHCHPPFLGTPGKQETFRCRWGTVYLYIPGEPSPSPHGNPPQDRRQYFTVWHEIILKPGNQYELVPNTLHWFQAGSEGAVISEFSSQSRDDLDILTDPTLIQNSDPN
jgi:D-lyxose ketol-isomerase